MNAEIDRLTRIEEKYTNLCDVLNEQTKEIEILRADVIKLRSICDAELIESADEIEQLRGALNRIVAHGVWNECIHCNAKVKIAEQALGADDE